MSKEKTDKKEEKQKTYTMQSLAFILKLAWKHKPSLFFWYLLQLIAEVTNNLLPVILPKYIMEYLVAIVNGTPYEEVKRKLLLTVGLLIGVGFICNCLVNTTSAVRDTFAEWFNRYLEKSVARQAMQMDFAYTEDPDVLDQLNKAKEGITWYSGGVEGIVSNFYIIVLNIFVMIGGIILVIFGCPWLIVIQGVGLLIQTHFNRKNNIIQVKSYHELSGLNRRFGYYFYKIADFSYGKDIRLYDSVDMFGERADTENKKMFGVWKKQATDCMKNDMAGNVVNTFRDTISYFYLGVLAIQKVITVGDFTMYVSAAGTFYWALWRIITGSQEVVKRCNYIREYIVFMQYPAEMEKGTEPISSESEHIIEFRDVSFRYPRSERYVLRHVNLTIRSGEHLSIVGLNGAGKTTFIKLLCRLYDVTSGEILVDGKNIKCYSDEEYRKLFAVVFQDFQLFAFSLKENVALTEADQADPAVIQRTLELSGVYEDTQKLEQGLDTIIFKSFDEKGTELSGGQKQKVAISRALYKNAPVVILDEPTAALDPVAEYEIYKKFHELVGGKTAIYISHRLSSCKFCDKIAVFAEDCIQEYGTHEELVAKQDGIYAGMFAAQAQYYI